MSFAPVAPDATAPASADSFPRAFGTYTLLGPLGQGGMGEVFIAKHGGVLGIEKHCVVKTLRAHLTDNREYAARFLDEARIVVQLSHKNVCHVFDVGSVAGQYYLAMEYIAGTDLRTLVMAAAQRKLESGLALHVAAEVLEALDYAHRHVDPSSSMPLRLVHRDVSPQNVMVSFEGEVKLIDFGLADSTQKIERTEPNVVLGKITYMPPEQLAGTRLDARADLFAVGVLLYELLAGVRYYEAMTPYEIYARAAEGYRPPHFASLHAELQALLAPALAPDREQRYPSAHAFREAVQALRLKHSLRGDAPALRALLETLMPAEIASSRALLTRVVRAADTSSHTPASTSALATPPHTVTATEDVAPRRRGVPLLGALTAASAAVAVAVVLVAHAHATPIAAPDAPHHPDPQPVAPQHVAPPHVDAPHVDAPHVDAPHLDAPHLDAPHVDAHVDAPRDVPREPRSPHPSKHKAHEQAPVDVAAKVAPPEVVSEAAPKVEPKVEPKAEPKGEPEPKAEDKPQAPRLRASVRVISRNELARAFKDVEGELQDRGHVAPGVANGVTVPLATWLFENFDLGPAQSATLYPTAMYWLVVSEAGAGKSRDEIARDLVRAQQEGRLK
ncbi:MAG TPA: protein kinase [Myxococcota bacterium]